MAGSEAPFGRSDFSRLDTFTWDEQFARYRCSACGEGTVLITAHVGYWLSLLENFSDLESAVEEHLREDLERHRGRCGCGGALRRQDCAAVWYCSWIPALDADLQVELKATETPPRVQRFILLKRDGSRRDLGAKLPAEILGALRGEEWSDLMRLGISCFMQGHSGRAIEAFQEATHKDATQSRAFAWLGRAYEQSGKDVPAETAYREAVRLGHPDAEVRLGLAQAVLAQGRPDEAIALYREAIGQGLEDQSAALAHANLGIALNDRGGLEEAVREWEMAIECDDKCAVAHFNLGYYHERAGRPDRAVDFYEAYLEAAPEAEDAADVRKHLEELRSGQKGR